MIGNKKITEFAMLSRLQPGEILLSPLIIRSFTELTTSEQADALVEVGFPDDSQSFRFVVEVKNRATPQAVQLAITQVKRWAKEGEWPMILVPFLSPERLDELEREKVSGVDLCGNGVVVVPGRLWVVRSGGPNRYRDSRPLSNPYRGRSAMVARTLLRQPRWESLSELVAAIQAAGGALSLPQASKAVQAMREDLILSKTAGAITLQEPLRLLDKLGSAWRTPACRARQSLQLPSGTDWACLLSSNPLLKWALTGDSSVTRYAMFSQGGPPRLAVSSLPLALTLLGGTPEPVPNFATVELMETDEPGFFFANETDEKGRRWASRLQTWLELQSGDARQQDAATLLRDQILKEVKA